MIWYWEAKLKSYFSETHCSNVTILPSHPAFARYAVEGFQLLAQSFLLLSLQDRCEVLVADKHLPLPPRKLIIGHTPNLWFDLSNGVGELFEDGLPHRWACGLLWPKRLGLAALCATVALSRYLQLTLIFLAKSNTCRRWPLQNTGLNWFILVFSNFPQFSNRFQVFSHWIPPFYCFSLFSRWFPLYFCWCPLAMSETQNFGQKSRKPIKKQWLVNRLKLKIRFS